MPPYKAYQTRPVTADLPEGDGYRLLVAAVLERAISDACGHGHRRGADRSADRLQAEARAWLTAPRGAEALLELAGYQADVVLRQVRQALDG